MEEQKSLSLLMQARVHLYRWFAILLGTEPTPAVLSWLRGEQSIAALNVFMEGRSESFGESDIAVELEKQSCDHLHDVYTRLFLGPAKLPLLHWESTYLGNGTALFQRYTLEVRKEYLASGFLPEGYPHVADDHIGIELDFMRALGEKSNEAFDKGKTGEALLLLQSSQVFLRDHLLRWVHRYAKSAKALDDYYGIYKTAIMLLPDCIETDNAALGELIAALREGVPAQEVAS